MYVMSKVQTNTNALPAAFSSDFIDLFVCFHESQLNLYFKPVVVYQEASGR